MSRGEIWRLAGTKSIIARYYRHSLYRPFVGETYNIWYYLNLLRAGKWQCRHHILVITT